MFRNFGVPELLVILAIVIILFGVGRLGRIGAELGKGIRNFRQALSGGEGEEEAEEAPVSGEQV
ncbi:MAG TPA: twin-arginine translocase TatA/TatE family subunit [Anaerolineales bacterium]|nr:twin-arginine translocase TatA/TatE family subunit [Anaerolineales bacterium]